MDVCTFFLNLLFRSVGFFGRKSCIYWNRSSLFLLSFKKIFSFFKSHSLFKLFWNCDWHVFRTCRFFFLKKIEGPFFARWLMRLPLKMSAASGQKKEKLSQAIKKTLEAHGLHIRAKFCLDWHCNCDFTRFLKCFFFQTLNYIELQ